MRAGLCIIGVAIFALGSCQKYTQADYDIALKNGTASLDVAREFNALFPDSNNFISYYTGQYGDPRWNSKVGLHGRYVLTVQFDLKFDSSRHMPARTSDPEFYLVEASQLDRTPDGRLSISYSDNQIRFGMEDWKKLIAARGELSAIGYSTNESNPHDGFAEVWQ